MLHRHAPVAFVILTTLVLVSCTSQPVPTTPTAGMPNPASVYCKQNGGILDLRTSETGAMQGVCVFPDGSECDEWLFFRGTCEPGDSLLPVEETPQEESQAPGDVWNTWQDEQLGFSFQYPPGASVVKNDDPLRGLSIVGPLVGDEHWPMFYISHPTDREEYRPPEDVALAQWLIEHNLIGENRLEDVQIAGMTAIHTRHEASPQSYAFDAYFFARSGQLYDVVIQHTGNMEDWSLYSTFLDSIRFDR
jgi:putative hemolysin